MNVVPEFYSLPAKEPPDTVHFLGNFLTFLARSAATDGRFSLTECRTAPGAGSPPHTQDDEEAFLILEGRFAFLIGDEMEMHGPGDFVFVKPGTVHAFNNPGNTVARMLIINLPGGLHEGFFTAVGDPVKPGQDAFPEMGPPNVALLTEIAARYGIRILPTAA